MTALPQINPPSSPCPLKPLPDQPEHWHRVEMTFDEAAEKVLDAHARDGRRDDLVVHRVNSWAFGSTHGETMELAPLPLPGRSHRDPVPLRDLAFSQLSQRLGVPAPFIKKLPAKLQIVSPQPL